MTEKQKTTEKLSELTDVELDLVVGGRQVNAYGTTGSAPARTSANPHDTPNAYGHGGF